MNFRIKFLHRKNPRVLRAKLKKIVNVSDDLFKVFNDLVIESGVDDSFDIFKVKAKKQMI